MNAGDSFFCACGKQCVAEHDAPLLMCRGCLERPDYARVGKFEASLVAAAIAIFCLLVKFGPRN